MAIGYSVRALISTEDTPSLGSRNVLPSREFSGDSWINDCYGNRGEEASSSAPKPVQEQAHGAQEIPKENLWNELEQPLIEERERRHQLSSKLAGRCPFRDHTYLETLRFQHEVKSHVDV